jgi:DNA polymerase eta
MKDLKLQDVRGLGGKLGDQVEHELGGILHCGQAWSFTIDQLKNKFGESQGLSPLSLTISGLWLYNIVRGVCDAKVTEKDAPKTMGCVKNFKGAPQTSLEVVSNWLSTLSCELYSRVLDEYETHKRWPKTLTLYANKKSKITTFPTRYVIILSSLVST